MKTKVSFKPGDKVWLTGWNKESTVQQMVKDVGGKKIPDGLYASIPGFKGIVNVTEKTCRKLFPNR